MEILAPTYTVGSSREPTHSIVLRQLSTSELVFYSIHNTALGDRGSFKLWTATLSSSASGTYASPRRGTFGSHPEAKPTGITFTEDPGVALMAADNGSLYVLRGSAVMSCTNVWGRGSPSVGLGCVVALEDGRWVAGALNGTVILGYSDERGGLQVEQRVPLSEMVGPDAKLFCASSPARLVDVCTGGSDGRTVFGTSDNSLVYVDVFRREMEVVQVSHQGEAWAMDFHPTLQILATGARHIRFWNIADCRPAVGRILHTDVEVRSLAFSPDGSLLAVGFINGYIEIHGFPALQPVFKSLVSQAQGCMADVVFGTSSGAVLLAAACSDRTVYLFKVSSGTSRQAAPAVKFHRALSGNSARVLSVMFSADGEYIMSSSFDTQIIIWATRDGARQPVLSAFRDTQWQQPWTCLLGWPVIGVWSDPDYDGSDVNTVCSSFPPEHNYCVSGDDRGGVRLYRFPGPDPAAKSKSYTGHSAHVTKVKFSRTNVLCALGGDDKAISQWVLQRPAVRRRVETQAVVHPWMALAEPDAPKDRFSYLGRGPDPQIDEAPDDHLRGFSQSAADMWGDSGGHFQDSGRPPRSAGRRRSEHVAPSPVIPQDGFGAAAGRRPTLTSALGRNRSGGVSSALRWD
eukprot:TRINITY_DN47245_c0_g1_i2.p1 TRINITY_DN47245_c0_g1~~TRINITY_DN47245_c0_g1_i2.p1  ORF type:complete len:629 (-),score=48.05 TRINITY_DN47245_c0_g1_i2:65-1951(-)